MGNKHGFTLLALVLVSCYVGDVLCGIIGERGNSLTFNPQTRGKLEEVTWTHNGKKVVEYDQQQILIFDPFKKRVVLDLYTGALTIKKLNAGDNGVYESTVVVDGKTQYSKHDLQVIDTVPEPKVTCKEADPESEVTTLQCGVDSDTPVWYRWRGPTVYDHPGSELQLGKQEDRDSVFTCLVKNEISEKYVTFTLRDCHKDGIAPGVIAGIILSVIGALCLLILIPLVLVCRRKQKKNPRTNQAYKQEDVENEICPIGYPIKGEIWCESSQHSLMFAYSERISDVVQGENKNLLSPAESTYNDTDEGATKKKPKGLFRAMHHKKSSGPEDTDNDERASFSLRATLPSHAKLQPPRVRHEQANGTCEAKDVNGPDQSSVTGLQRVDHSTEKLTPVSVEVATLDQSTVVVPLSSHGTRLVPAIINISASEEHMGPQMTVKQDRDQSMDEDEELANGSPEGVLEEVKPYHSHNITVTIEGTERRESLEEEEHVSDTEKGTDQVSESGAEEEKQEHRPRTDSKNNQEEEGRQQEEPEENHEILVQESSMGKERNGEVVHSDQTEEEEADISEVREELPETEQVLKEHLKEDVPKEKKENEHNGQHEAEVNSETENIGREEDSGPVQERGRMAVEEEEDIITQEQPLRESEQGNSTPEPQGKTELEVQQIQIGDGEEQEPRGDESLDEEKTGDEEDGEDEELDPEKKSHDGREREMESAVEQGDDGKVNTYKKEENELRHDPDEDAVSGDSEQEDQLALLQVPEAKVETDETNGDESVMKSPREEKRTIPEEDKKQEEQNHLKEGGYLSAPEKKNDVTEEQDNSLPKDQDIQDVSVTDETTDEESKIKSEHETTESNPQLEEKSEEEREPVRQDDHSMPKEEPVKVGKQDRLPEDERTDEVISDDDETQDNQGRKPEIVNDEKDFKPEQAETDQQPNDTKSLVVHENEASTPETKDEGKTENESDTHLEEKTHEEQNPPRQEDDHSKPQEEPVVPEEQDQSTDKVVSDDETQQDQDQGRETDVMSDHDQPKDSLQDFKQAQAELNKQQNDAKSPVVHENRVSSHGTKDEDKIESEQENEQRQEEGREENELPKTECVEKATEPSDELLHKAPLEDLEETGEKEEKGQIDSPPLQDQPLQEEQLITMNLEEKPDKANITDSSGEEENESDAHTDTDVRLAKEKSEGEAQMEGKSELEKGEVSEVAADKVQEDPAVGNEAIIAVDEKEHNAMGDPVTEHVGDLCKTEKPHPPEEKHVDQRPDRTQKDGQQDDLNNSTSDRNRNKTDEKDNEMNANQPEKEVLMEGERDDTRVPPEETDEDQSQVEHRDDDDEADKHDEKQSTGGEEPMKGNDEEDQMKQMELANSENNLCENKDGGTIVPEKNEKINDSQSEKEKNVQMHHDDMGQSTEQVSEESSQPQKLK